MTIEDGVEQVRGLMQGSHDRVRSECPVGERGRLQGRHARVLIDDPALVQGSDDSPETFDDGGGEVGPLGGLIGRPGQGGGVAVAVSTDSDGVPPGVPRRPW